MSINFETTITLNNGASYKINSNGHQLIITNIHTEQSYLFKDDGSLVNLEDEIEVLRESIQEVSDYIIKKEPTIPEFITLTQIRGVMKESDIIKYLGEPDNYYYKYWVKGSPITTQWKFNNVIKKIRENTIQIRFTAYFWSSEFYLKDDAYIQIFFIELKSEIDEKNSIIKA